MQISTISKYPVIQEGIAEIIKENYATITSFPSIDDFMASSQDHSNTLLIINLFTNYVDIIDSVISIRDKFSCIKILIIDFTENEDIFFNLSRIGIEGYLLGNFAKEDLIYAITKIVAGSKFYDRELLYKIAERHFQISPSNKNVVTSQLTDRESQILNELSNGLSNFEIACALKISENTVKKHISNIFVKLNVKDRSQAIIYAYNSGLLSK